MNSVQKAKQPWELVDTLSGEVMIPFGIQLRLIVRSMSDVVISVEDRATLELVVLDTDQDEVTLRVLLAGEGANAWIRSIVIVSGSSKKNITISAEHICSRTTADIRTRAAIFDRGVAMLNGIAKIPVDVAEIDTYFSGHELLMSEGARGDVVPTLEILSDDVKAGHSASVGSLDELDLFYLQSRGLSSDESRQELMEGFLLSDIVGVDDGTVVAEVKSMILRKLGKDL